MVTNNSIQEHEAILDAIQAGDAVLAEKLVREHARLALRGVRSAIDTPAHAAKTKVSANKASTAKNTPPRIQHAEPAGPTSQLVLEAARPLAVGRRDEQRLAFKVSQPLCEGVRRDTADVLEQLVEAARAAEERVDEEKRPAVADTLQRLCERRIVHATIVLRETLCRR